jgi:hypothetical protein
LTLPALELRPTAVQPVADRYTDYVIDPVYVLVYFFIVLKLLNINTQYCRLGYDALLLRDKRIILNWIFVKYV